MARESAAKESMRDKIRRRNEETSYGGGGGRTVNLPEGVKWFENKGGAAELDFLPYVITDPQHPEVLGSRFAVGDLIDSRAYWVHRDVGAEQKLMICLKTIGKPCPICEAYVSAKKNASLSKEEVEPLRSKVRVLYNVIDLNTKDQKVQVWDVSWHNFTKMMIEEQKINEDLLGYADLVGGSTMSIRFREKKIGKQEFFEASRIDGTPREPYEKSILKEVVNLDESFQILSYEQLEAIFLGTEAAGRSAPEPAKRRSAPEPENAPDPHRHDPDAQRGRGKTPPPTADDEYKGELDEAPAKPAKPAAKSADNACPHGYVFGVDLDTKDECDSCDVWDECRHEKKKGAAKPASPQKPAPGDDGPPKRRR